MAITISGSNSIFDGASVALVNNSDILTVLSDGYLIGTSGVLAFLGPATGQTYNVSGSIMGFGPDSSFQGRGIVANNSGVGSFINIANSGTVYGAWRGIEVSGYSEINNGGNISSGSFLSTISVTGNSDSVIRNFATGRIASENGACIEYSGTGTHQLDNAGVLSPGGPFFSAISAFDDSVEVINNTGYIGGSLSLGLGRDIVRTIDGFVDGAADMGGGNDIYHGSDENRTDLVNEDLVYSDIVFGGDGNDKLFGNAGSDELHGGAGSDRIVGGLDGDTLWGNGGNDRFVFEMAEDLGFSDDPSVLSIGNDRIHDFDRSGNDVIDLAGIDAKFTNVLEEPNEAFMFRGTAAFTGTGQVRVVALGANSCRLDFNITGSLASDFSLELRGTNIGQIDVGDFFL